VDSSSLEDIFEQQCNTQDMDIGNYNNYRYEDQDDQDDVSNSDVKV